MTPHFAFGMSFRNVCPINAEEQQEFLTTILPAVSDVHCLHFQCFQSRIVVRFNRFLSIR
jgi:hypothetical protein